MLRGVNFDSNQAALRPDALAILEETSRVLSEESDLVIVLEGHADDKERHQLTLSKQRAAAVRDYLVAHGVIITRIRVEGVGATAPVASNDTAAGRAQNRRVEIRTE